MQASGRTGDGARRLSRPLPEDLRRCVAEAEALLELHQKERSRIAFDIHDGPAQSIATALLQVRLLKTGEPGQLQDGFEELERQLLVALDQLYASMEQLRSKALDQERFVPKLEALASEFSSRTGIPVTFSAETSECDLSNSLQIAVFQIVHEALQNIGRHADANAVSVKVRMSSESVDCSIVDDGIGFDPSAQDGDRERTGYGITGMRERARLLGGECHIVSRPGGGCRVEARIPIWRG